MNAIGSDNRSDLVERQSRFVFRAAYAILRNARDNEDGGVGAVPEDLSRRRVIGVLDALRIYPEDGVVFSVRTHLEPKEPKICRDDRVVNQHFLRPAAQKLGICWKGSGFYTFRRDAVTAILPQRVWVTR